MKGFTLVETLVAIAILAVSIVGPFVAIQNALTASYVARDNLVATMLAQEAVEYVRGIRDGNYLYRIANPTATRSWLYGIDGTEGTTNCIDGNPNDATALNCVIDPTGNSPIELCASNGSGSCPPLNFSPSTNIYTQASGFPATRFTRTLTMWNVTDTEVRIQVTVSWNTNHNSYSLVVSDSLYNWL